MRPTSELVILALSIGVSITMMIAAAGIVLLTMLQPERDLTGPIDAISRLMTVVVGVVVGYLAGWARERPRR
jgi:ribose/xylose/arabinose/galactoside ABC-type transport system permease subunit